MPIRQPSQIGSCLTIRRSYHCAGQKPPLTLDEFFNAIDIRSAEDEYSPHDGPATMNPEVAGFRLNHGLLGNNRLNENGFPENWTQTSILAPGKTP